MRSPGRICTILPTTARTGRDLSDSAVLIQKNSLRAEIDGFHDLTAALLDCAVLERFTDAVEEHNADRLAKFTDRERTDRRNAHQEVFVHDMAGLHILECGEEDFASEDQIGDHKTADRYGGIEWERSSPMINKAAPASSSGISWSCLSSCVSEDGFPSSRISMTVPGSILISDRLHLREKLCSLGRVDTELSCRERQDTIVDFREFLDLFLDLCGAVCAVDVFHHIDCADAFGFFGRTSMMVPGSI